MKQVHLVRHAESHSNAGLPSEFPHLNDLTDTGKTQAKNFALSWKEQEPDLIVCSPFVRAQLTGEPFIGSLPCPEKPGPSKNGPSSRPKNTRGPPTTNDAPTFKRIGIAMTPTSSMAPAPNPSSSSSNA